MKIAQLSGRSLNAGDHLIELKSTDLLKHCFPNAQINIYLRKEVPNYLDEINSADVVIFTGGPLLQELSYTYPLEAYMSINKPMMMLGVGARTDDGSIEHTDNYTFTSQTLDFFRKINDHGLGYGCRDLYTKRILLNHGLTNAIITGCPAWYNISHVGSTDLRNNNPIRHICVSSPWQSCYINQTLDVLSYLSEKYKNAKISFVFHEQLDADFCNAISHCFPNIEIVYIANCVDKMRIYDNCDLHVGYRVHAHIYNLSIRNRSILIEEDGRGAGVNEALGLLRLTAYKDNIKRRFRTFIPIVKKYYPIDFENHHIIEELAICLDSYEQTDWMYLENAFRLQNNYYNDMKKFIHRIDNLPMNNLDGSQTQGDDFLSISKEQEGCLN